MAALFTITFGRGSRPSRIRLDRESAGMIDVTGMQAISVLN